MFLKSLSALRDNNLSPANENAGVLQAGRLVGAMGINSSDNSYNEGTFVRFTLKKYQCILDKEKFEKFLKFQ